MERTGIVCALLASAAIVAGCANTDADLVTAIDELRTDLELRDERILLLEDELDDLRGEVTGLRLDGQRDRSASRLDDVEATLGGVVGAVAEIDEAVAVVDAALEAVTEELAAGSRARAELAETSEAADAELRDELAGLRGAVDRAAGRIEDLEVRYDTLRERVDRISAR